MAEPRFLKTRAGIFKVVVNDDIHTNVHTREKIVTGKLISVGGKNTCVFIKTFNNSTNAHLNNVKTSSGGCEVNNKKIVGENTVIMVKLAFTIVREIAPHVKTIELDDSSVFTCELEDEGSGSRSFGISIALYELAFHQSTWYERHFNAKLETEAANDAYLKAKEGFYKPKPENFNFLNNSLNQLLTPIYKSTKTWKEFFTEIYKIENKCRIMFPWYKRAVSSAMGGMVCENQIRIIDIYKFPNDAIEYKLVKLGSRGGTRKVKDSLLDYGEPIDYILERLKYIPNEDVHKIEFTKADLKQTKKLPKVDG